MYIYMNVQNGQHPISSVEAAMVVQAKRQKELLVKEDLNIDLHVVPEEEFEQV